MTEGANAAMTETMACAVCGRVLDYVRDRGYIHSAALSNIARDEWKDHIAVPVRPDEIATDWRCDFCSSPRPLFVLPARDIRVSSDSGSVGDWLACVDCASLIDRNEWTALHRRVVRTFPLFTRDGRAMRSETEQHLRVVYRRLRAAITGPLRPFDPAHPHD